MKIQELVKLADNISVCNNYKAAREKFDIWVREVRKIVMQQDRPETAMQEILLNTHFVENEYSTTDSLKRIKESVENTMILLNSLPDQSELIFSEATALHMLRMLLSNFYKYLKAMYQDDLHGKCTIEKDILERIAIRNEYDLQRMVYPLLLPLFPTARQEVNDDNGYSGVRFDIYIDEYDFAIELKYTGSHMTEKMLTEQLGADGFHYKVKTLFVLIYDKEQLIKNPDAYKRAFQRNRKEDGKSVELFIIHPVNL